MSKDISIKVVSWNMGESVTEIDDWIHEINNWDIISSGPDILFLGIQEASNKVGESIAEALQAKLGQQYDIYREGRGTRMPTLHFHVFGYLCVKKTLDIKSEPVEDNKNDKSIDSYCIMKKRICTKPAVGFGIEANGKKLIFVSSHLPIDTKDKETYGYDLRIDAINKIKKEVIQDVETALNGKADNIFWTGDLNFRIVEENGEEVEQFEKAMKVVLQNYKEHDKKNVAKTCRYLEYEAIEDKEATPEEILERANQFIEARVKAEKSAFDPKRKRSYCDRVVYKGEFNVKDYYSWPKPDHPQGEYPLSILYSDHIPIVLEGKIPLAPSKRVAATGGDRDLYKYIKYKTKYLQLLNNR